MGVDVGIYQNLLQRPKSIADYDQENQQFQTNALNLQQARQGIADQNALRTATQQFGGDSAANLATLQRSGLYKQANDYQKSIDESGKAKSEIAKNAAQTTNYSSEATSRQLGDKIKAHDFQIQKLGSVTDPQSLVNWAADGVQSGAFPLEQAQAAVTKALQQIQAPGGLEAWKQQALQGGMSAKDQLQQQLDAQKAAETNRHNVSTEGLTASSNAETARNHRTTEGIAGAHLGIARDAASGVDYKQDGDGNWVALPKKAAAGTTIVATPITTADGKPLAGATKPLTEGQGKATTFAARMQDAEGAISQLEAQGVSGKDMRTIAAGNAWTNFLASPKGQQYRQAQENWVTANLRQESGAAIGKDEMEKDVRKFFPTPGDSAEVIQQKAQARQVARQGMVMQAGPGAKQIPAILKNAATPSPSTHPADIADLLGKYGAK